MELSDARNHRREISLIGSDDLERREAALLHIMQQFNLPLSLRTDALIAVVSTLEILERSDPAGLRSSPVEAAYGVAALVGLIQDMIDDEQLSEADVAASGDESIPRALRIATRAIAWGDASIAGEDGTQHGKQPLSIVLPCMALVLNLSSLSSEVAACAPDTTPRALIICLERVLAVKKKKQADETNRGGGEAAADGGEELECQDEDEAVQEDTLLQLTEYTVMSCWYQTRVHGRAAEMVVAGAPGALQAVVSAFPGHAESIGATACSAMVHLLGPIRRRLDRLEALRAARVESGGDADDETDGDGDVEDVADDEFNGHWGLRDDSSRNAFECAPSEAVNAAATMLRLTLDRFRRFRGGVGTVGGEDAQKEAEAVAGLVASCDLPRQLLSLAGSCSAGDSRGSYRGYGSSGLVREEAAVDGTSAALQSLFQCLLGVERNPHATTVTSVANGEGKLLWPPLTTKATTTTTTTTTTTPPLPPSLSPPSSSISSNSHSPLAVHAPDWVRDTIMLLLSLLFSGAATEKQLSARIRRGLQTWRQSQEGGSEDHGFDLGGGSNDAWCVGARPSSLEAAGGGLFVTRGTVPAATAVAVYPGEWRGDDAQEWWDSLAPGHAAEHYTTSFSPPSTAMLDGSPEAVERCALDAMRRLSIITTEDEGNAGASSSPPTPLSSFLETCLCLGNLANHPAVGQLPSLVFYEVPIEWIDQSGKVSDVGGSPAKEEDMRGSEVLGGLPVRVVSNPATCSQRMDKIIILATLRECHEGEELLVDYGIGSGIDSVTPLTSSECPSWYSSPLAHLGLHNDASSDVSSTFNNTSSWKIQGLPCPTNYSLNVNSA